MPRIIGVTGTNGKTTTAHLLHHLLAANNFSVGLIGTVHISWPGRTESAAMTTPDNLSLHEIMGRMVAGGVEYVVMEVSSHALVQERLAGLPVEVGVFSNLTQDHLDYHHDMESYFQAKARLFTGDDPGCAKGLVNEDDAYGRRLLEMRRILSATVGPGRIVRRNFRLRHLGHAPGHALSGAGNGAVHASGGGGITPIICWPVRARGCFSVLSRSR